MLTSYPIVSDTTRTLAHSWTGHSLAISDRKSMKFPLPADTFPPLEIAPENAEALENFANHFVQERMAEFHEHAVLRKGVVDSSFWKKVKDREQVSVYKQRKVDPTATDENGVTALMPMMLTVGLLQGNLDDVMYGAMNRSTEDMRIRSVYVGDRMCDGRQLASLIQPSTADPLRSLTLKWDLKENLTLTPFVRMRDVVLIEGTGIVQSTTGERIGYHLIHSVELPGIRELHEYNIVRCKISFCFIYQQVADNVVSVYAKGIVNVSGSMPLAISTLTAGEALVSVWRYMQCAELKKLAWVARTTKPTDRRQQNPNACAVCTEKLKPVTGDDTKSCCCVCRERVCSRCGVSKRLAYYLPRKPNALSLVKMKFCVRCVLRAKQTSAIEVAAHEVSESQFSVVHPFARDTLLSQSSLSTA